MANGECWLCTKTLKNPVSVPCGHLFCSKCLNDYARPKRSAVRECPTCEAKFYNVPSSDVKEIRADLKKKGIPKEVRALLNEPVRKIHCDFYDAQKSTAEELEKLEELVKVTRAALIKHKDAENQAKVHNKRLREELEEVEKRVKALTDANYDLDWEMKEQEQQHIQVVKHLSSKHVEQETDLRKKLKEARDEVVRLTAAFQEEESQHHQQEIDYYNNLQALQQDNASMVEKHSAVVEQMQDRLEISLREAEAARRKLAEYQQTIEDEQAAHRVAQGAIASSLWDVMLYGCVV